MPDFYSGNSVNCVLLDVTYMKQRGKNNWSPIPESTAVEDGKIAVFKPVQLSNN